MMKRRQERLLLYIYVAMVMLCLYLNYWTANSMANIMVNAGLFFIVGLIYVHAFMCFRDVNKMMHGLDKVSAQIRRDFDEKQDFLWEDYQKEEINFDTGVLNKRYREYQQEMKRLALASAGGYRCSIEDYINRDLIDRAIDRTMLNLVAGTMTGLGILGTFIGLSFGLQSFSTGTAQEITDSIGPLMEGIKVAFHTSIYGMVFSLSFHFVYKKKLEDANRSMDAFLDIHQKYVVPDAQHDMMNMLMNYQKQLADGTDLLAQRIGEQVAKAMRDIMLQQLERDEDGIQKK